MFARNVLPSSSRSTSLVSRALKHPRNTSIAHRRPQQVRNFLAIVHQGHEAWRLSFGRNPVKLEPGLRIMIPFYHTIQEVDLRETSVSLVFLFAFMHDVTHELLSYVSLYGWSTLQYLGYYNRLDLLHKR